MNRKQILSVFFSRYLFHFYRGNDEDEIIWDINGLCRDKVREIKVAKMLNHIFYLSWLSLSGNLSIFRLSVILSKKTCINLSLLGQRSIIGMYGWTVSNILVDVFFVSILAMMLLSVLNRFESQSLRFPISLIVHMYLNILFDLSIRKRWGGWKLMTLIQNNMLPPMFLIFFGICWMIGLSGIYKFPSSFRNTLWDVLSFIPVFWRVLRDWFSLALPSRYHLHA